jgi:hypothetical protein
VLRELREWTFASCAGAGFGGAHREAVAFRLVLDKIDAMLKATSGEEVAFTK